VLGKAGARAQPFIGNLTLKLSDADVSVRQQAALALGEIGPVAAPALGALLNIVLRGGVAEVRRCAAQAVRKISPDGKDVFRPLTKALKDGQVGGRVRAAALLAEYGPACQGLVPELTAALNDPNLAVQRHCATALARLERGAAEPAGPALVECLKRSDPQLVQTALGALANIGGPARAAIPAITDLLDAQPAEVRTAALSALGVILEGTTAESVSQEPAVKRAIQKLVSLLEEDAVYPAARESLVKIGAAAGPQLGALLSLNKKNTAPAELRLRAIATLKEMGPNARKQLPALQRIVKANDPVLSGPAREAVQVIQKK
jgi:HEAT repeat protein